MFSKYKVRARYVELDLFGSKEMSSFKWFI